MPRDELDDLLKRDRVLSSSKAEQVHEKVVPVSFIMPQERGPLQVYARNRPNHRWICKTSSAHADGKTQKMRPTLIDEELLQMEVRDDGPASVLFQGTFRLLTVPLNTVGLVCTCWCAAVVVVAVKGNRPVRYRSDCVTLNWEVEAL